MTPDDVVLDVYRRHESSDIHATTRTHARTNHACIRYKCFLDSKEEEKGSDCLEPFRSMQQCFSENPDHYEVINPLPVKVFESFGCLETTYQYALLHCLADAPLS